ncbi:hypothetical protein GUITHDRAFT_102498 [Guillardia theta CCMP2712]|uniref:Uncharacterized protein n=1 Tax=Guillardia theta (strain CCMP2712) TaxID=905079 RepID=L1JUX6_GUITC|nr:hypothetical protein GUITHDRAFT_102498 [Guillardia theta CCMP2712]EKX51883.1 hypothetical protein GUITHDRAFT_102498 [Guillardia theta CCMP2712]|eukprot:XP_005838863.1 hypothetical protein GUITHDRAFT_102498 [Guillardia theta CCMP2712]
MGAKKAKAKHEKEIKKSESLQKPKVEDVKSKSASKWGNLVYLCAVHFKGFNVPGQVYEMSSFAEGKLKKLVGNDDVDDDIDDDDIDDDDIDDDDDDDDGSHNGDHDGTHTCSSIVM